MSHGHIFHFKDLSTNLRVDDVELTTSQHKELQGRRMLEHLNAILLPTVLILHMAGQ